MRLVLRAGFDRYSGYGNDAVDLAVNLAKAGVDVVPWPLSLLPGLPAAFTRLLEKDPRGPKDVVLTFAPPYDVKPWEVARGATKLVGYSMWERTPIRPADLAAHDWPADVAAGGRAWEGLDLMVVTCPMNVEAFRGVDTEVPIQVVPCGIEPGDWPEPPHRRDRDRPLQFLMVGMLNGRKDPFALLDVWRDLKATVPGFDARLHLHTLAPGLHPALVDTYGPDLTLSQRPLDRDGMVGMYHAADVMISVSRGEGNNKPAMEFMATGGTVMATDWGGHQNWLHRDVAYPLPGTLHQVDDPALDAQEFRVDPDALRATILHAWQHRDEVARKQALAGAWIRQTHAWPVVVDRLIRHLEAA